MDGMIFYEGKTQAQDNGEMYCTAKRCSQASSCIYKTNPAPHSVADLSCSKMCPKNEGIFDNS